MKKYAQNHYSFDIWLTLIKSNPEFKKQRTIEFHRRFNPTNKTVEEVDAIIRSVDKMCDTTNEKVSGCIHAFQMISFILVRLEFPIEKMGLRDIHAIYHQMESLFFAFQPTLYDDNTKRVLSELKSNGATLSTLSNTGFIACETMKKLLLKLGIYDMFIFQLYSDHMGVSKPDRAAFMQMIDLAKTSRLHSNPCTRIIHVGDNPDADIKGAIEAGIEAFQINTNDKTIKDLLL